MSQVGRSPSCSNRRGVLVAFSLMLWAVACAPSTGSESHYMEACGSADGAGVCVCDRWTEPCTEDAECADRVGVEGAVCLPAAVRDTVAACEESGAGPREQSFCLLPCDSPSQCGVLGAGATCNGGLCVGGSGDLVPDIGLDVDGDVGSPRDAEADGTGDADAGEGDASDSSADVGSDAAEDADDVPTDDVATDAAGDASVPDTSADVADDADVASDVAADVAADADVGADADVASDVSFDTEVELDGDADADAASPDDAAGDAATDPCLAPGTVTTQEQLNALSGCRVITGSLVIDGGAITTLAPLEGLVEVTASLRLTGVDNLLTVDIELPALASVGEKLELNDVTRVAVAASFPALRSAGAIGSQGSTTLTSISAPALTFCNEVTLFDVQGLSVLRLGAAAPEFLVLRQTSRDFTLEISPGRWRPARLALIEAAPSVVQQVVAAIDGVETDLRIEDHPTLDALPGLASWTVLPTSAASISIINNRSLPTCQVLADLALAAANSGIDAATLRERVTGNDELATCE